MSASARTRSPNRAKVGSERSSRRRTRSGSIRGKPYLRPLMSSRSSSRLFAIGLALLLFGAAIGTPADADLWGHLTFGRDIVTEGTIVQPDLYSFTADRPWVNHEWLAEVVFFSIYRFAGSAGLIAWKTAMIAALCGLVWWRLRRAGAGWDVALLLIGLVFVGTYWRMHSVRPQVFSVLFFAVL